MTLGEAIANPPSRLLTVYPFTEEGRDYELTVYMDATATVLDVEAYQKAQPPGMTPEQRLLHRVLADDGSEFRYPATIPLPLYFTLREHAETEKEVPESLNREIEAAIKEIFQTQVLPRFKSKQQG